MNQRLLTQDDIIQSQEQQERFGETITINPLQITRNCGLLKDYKNLKDITELFIEFDGINEKYDIGKGIFKRVDTETKEDFGVVIKIGRTFYKRQYDGYVLFDWFNNNSLDILVSILQKYKNIKLSNRRYEFNLDKTYNIQVNQSFQVDCNQAEIEFISENKLDSIFKLFFNKPIEYALFTNAKLKFNANTFVTSIRSANCKYFDFYTENVFVDIDSAHISLTNGNVIDGLPANIQSQKIFSNIVSKKETTIPTDTEFLSVKDLDTLSFVINYVYAYNRTSQNVKGQKTFTHLRLPLATENNQYCNMQNLDNIIEKEMEQQLLDYTLTKAKEIGLEVSGSFPEGSVYVQFKTDNQFKEAESPVFLFGEEDGIKWTNLTEYIQNKFKELNPDNEDNRIGNFSLRKNKLRDNAALYIAKQSMRQLAPKHKYNSMNTEYPQQMLSNPEDYRSDSLFVRQDFILWYKGDCTKIEIKE